MSFRNAKGGYIRPGYDPLEVSNPPTSAAATAGSASASVSFTAPTNVGGSAITNYYAVSNPGQITASSVTSPIAVSGLSNGTEYTFKVWGENSYGPSAYSAPTGAVTPSPPYIEDVFSTYLYTGTGSAQTITNGIDLSGEGGLVWIKWRSGGGLGSSDNALYDTTRGVNNLLVSNSTAAQVNTGTGSNASVSAFNSNGFSLGADALYGRVNYLNGLFASWTFRKAEKFFDVVTYTGNGSSTQTINHNLGSVPGCMIVKCSSSTGSWFVYHRSLGNDKDIFLNTTGAERTGVVTWNSFTPTATQFEITSAAGLNTNAVTYVAYLFAHDAGGFGDSGSDNVISCGSFTTDGSGNADINLGYEAQFVMLKSSQYASNWIIEDNMRGLNLTQSALLLPNTSDAEINGTATVRATATGFATINGQLISNATYIYIAIRRGPMKTPTTGTSVFVPQVITESTTGLNTITSNFPVDWVFTTTSDTARRWGTRLPGNQTLATSSISAETNFGTQATAFDSNTTAGIIGTAGSAVDAYMYAFRRAPGFFDEVCFTTTDGTYSGNHNLGVVPELLIFKSRNGTGNWQVVSSYLTSAAYFLRLDSTIAEFNNTNTNYTATSTTFTIPNAGFISFSANMVAYLFATCPGVSKVGSYTGTGTTQQVNCGFTGGARFVMIKRTDDTGDWYVWDSARGIVSGNDPYFFMNSTLAAVTNTDYVDTYSAGFEISSTAPAAINANGGTFIYLAIA